MRGDYEPPQGKRILCLIFERPIRAVTVRERKRLMVHIVPLLTIAARIDRAYFKQERLVILFDFKMILPCVPLFLFR